MKFLATILFTAVSLVSYPVMGAQKIVGEDERIKTFVYDPSEIYRIVTRSNFQTTIEFGPDETIDTLSVGDSIGWQLTPAGKRLFLKPIHKSGITNLSVITTRRSYQFELVATSSSSLSSSHSFVVRFYYPENSGMQQDYTLFQSPDQLSRGNLRPVSPTPIPALPEPYIPPQPAITSPLPGDYYPAPAPAPMVMSAPMPSYAPPPPSYNPPASSFSGTPNYNYTLSGPNTLAPLKIYDDGTNTYLQFPPSAGTPQISAVGANGQEYPLTVSSSNGMAVVNVVAPKLSIRQGSDAVFVYNENNTSGGYGR